MYNAFMSVLYSMFLCNDFPCNVASLSNMFLDENNFDASQTSIICSVSLQK